jgi:Flp pilus assembly protein TadB
VFLQTNCRFYSSRTARYAAGEDRHASQQQQQGQGQQEQQQQQLEAQRRAYLQTTCFTRLNQQQRKAAMGDHRKPLLIVAGVQRCLLCAQHVSLLISK